MYCIECGRPGAGRFCAHCGAQQRVEAQEGDEPAFDWQEALDYDAVTRHPDVRRALTAAADRAPTRMSGEEFLARIDEAAALIGAPAFFSSVGQLAQPLFAAMGVRVRPRTRVAEVAAPPGVVLVRTLTGLARQGVTVASVQQAQDGCVLSADIPSDLWSFKGELVCSLQRLPDAVRVEAVTAIKGQLYDWGKSERILRGLFAEVEAATR
jgi:hypothetical protein